jgi:hypothetical protein
MTPRVTPDDLNRIAGQLTALGELMRLDPKCHCGCRTLAIHAHRVARHAEGPPGPTPNGRNSRGSHSDPTFATYLNPDPSDHWLARYTALAHGTSRFATALAALVHQLGTITTTEPRELTATGSGDCQACGRYCSGSATDRLVAGMCDTDYRRWCRHGRPDRFEFCRDTPAHDSQGEVAS